jgi:hypothetical protein
LKRITRHDNGHRFDGISGPAQQVRGAIPQSHAARLEPDLWDLWMEGTPDAAAALTMPAHEYVPLSRTVNKAVGQREE